MKQSKIIREKINLAPEENLIIDYVLNNAYLEMVETNHIRNEEKLNQVVTEIKNGKGRFRNMKKVTFKNQYPQHEVAKNYQRKRIR